MKMFLCSVIIPVYNAEKFLEFAVESAVHQEEVGEIILVEDGSPDNALVLCRRLIEKYPKVRLFQHLNGENRGASESRNLGVSKAGFEFISFLDADDYYLPHRFQIDKVLFQKPQVDGVYNAVVNINLSDPRVKIHKSVSKEIPPTKLFHFLLRGTYGHFHTNGITLRRDLLSRTGGFDSTLKLHQDTELWLRCAYGGNLFSGNILDPTAVVVTHGQNRILGKSKNTRLMLFLKVLQTFPLRKVSLLDYAIIVTQCLRSCRNLKDLTKVAFKLKW
jgi:glycosyltransferase involved in cell wall biosynthesis